MNTRRTDGLFPLHHLQYSFQGRYMYIPELYDLYDLYDGQLMLPGGNRVFCMIYIAFFPGLNLYDTDPGRTTYRSGGFGSRLSR